MNILKLVGVALVFLVVLFFSTCSITKVPAGNVGVKVYLLGGEKGVDQEVVGVGRYLLTWNEDLYLFPTFTQNTTWDLSSDNDNSITFQTVEGLSVNGDFGISYRIDPSKVSDVFQKYRRGIDEITNVFLRNMVRDSLATRASKLKVDSVYGEGKENLIRGVEEDVRKQVADIGILIEKIYLTGELRLPKPVMDSLNEKVRSTQMAEQRRNEVQQSKAEADKAIEAAKGTAESIRINALAEAEAIRIRGEALRQNPNVIELEAINKWDGTLPQFMGGNGAVPFVNIDKKN